MYAAIRRYKLNREHSGEVIQKLVQDFVALIRERKDSWGITY